MAKHVLIRYKVHTWLQQPGGSQTVERNKGDEDVVSAGYANELRVCGLAEIIGTDADVPVLVEFKEIVDHVSS